MHHFFDRFLHRFLDGPRRPKSAQDGDPSAKTAPRSSPRRPQEGPKKLSDIVRFRVWPPRALQTPSGPPPDPLRTPSGPSPDPLRKTIFGLLISNTPAKPTRSLKPIKHTSQTNSGGIYQCRTTGGLRPQLRRDAKTEGENELSHAHRSADSNFLMDKAVFS